MDDPATLLAGTSPSNGLTNEYVQELVSTMDTFALISTALLALAEKNNEAKLATESLVVLCEVTEPLQILHFDMGLIEEMIENLESEESGGLIGFLF